MELAGSGKWLIYHDFYVAVDIICLASTICLGRHSMSAIAGIVHMIASSPGINPSKYDNSSYSRFLKVKK
jgi:hypothetical protein